MLPYTPLHHLLLAGVGRPLVMTSGNLSDEPIAHDDDDALARLGPLVDGLLTHDRPIHIRCDDSVVRADAGRGIQVLRRSRGLRARAAAAAVRAPGTPVLAVGAELKNTVAVTTGDDVVASHHIGDLEHLATYQSFLQAVDHLCRLYGVRARGGRPRPAPRVPVDQVRPRPRPPTAGRAAPPRPHRRRAWSSTAAPSPVARRGLRRARLRHRRHAVGRRVPGRRPRRVRAGRPSARRADAGRCRPRSASRGAWRSRGH